MTKLLVAYTKPGSDYPGYVNLTEQDDGSVILTVRGDPTVAKGRYVCGYASDKGCAGRCTPGDEHCNNYCNLAPEKGRMADSPKDCTYTVCGETVAIRLSAAELASLKLPA